MREETLIIDGQRYELSANQYPGAVHPQGFQYQTSFRLDPFPRLTYETQGAYHMDYGAAAAKYVDAFLQNVNWEEVNRRTQNALSG